MRASLSACIISSHDVYNSGASLQAYALRTNLEKIWNTAIPNSKDSAIYLTFALDKAVKADYVASFAEERIEDAYEQNVKSWLHDSNFILNSSLPIIIVAYFIFNIAHRDTIYKLQNNSAFWALMMYTSFSNKFAQLAWFIMPIVCIYPWMKQTFWHMVQSKRLGNYILISYAYTFFSHFILSL